MEQNRSDNLVVAATNTPELLDAALFRRFDDVVVYGLPGPSDRQRLIANSLGTFADRGAGWNRAVESSDNMSASDIVQACYDALKHAILSESKLVTADGVLHYLSERRGMHLP
jgi:SpoVK/Ycf46/Vps4 family AAA+-type ATPase